jgi:hypothetical protein
MDFYEFLFEFIFLVHFLHRFLHRKHWCRILDLLQGVWCQILGDKPWTDRR